MPVYEYECSACNHRFEEWQKISDDPIKVCPKCSEAKVERLISQTSFQLKGGGWYGDLYSSTKKTGGGSGSGSSSSGSGGSSSGGSGKSGSSAAAV